MNSKIAAIVNPHSAGGRTGKRWPEIARRLERRVGPVEVRFTERPGHAIELTRKLLAEEFDLVAGVGGDGTFNEMANGFIEADELVRPSSVMGILPAGTGGDFQRMFGFNGSNAFEQALDTLVSGERRLIDAGKAKFMGFKGQTQERYFVNLVSFGMGGSVAMRARNALGLFGGRTAFLWATFRVLLSYRGRTIRVILDDAVAPAEYHVTNVAVGNGRFHGGGMHPCPTAVMDDGVLEVTVIEYMNMLRLLRDIRVLYSGEIYQHPKAYHLRGIHVIASAEQPTDIEVDGEPLGKLPLEISVLPRKLPVLMRAASVK
ncbi:MAG: diacylglycerol/lipid kinase family protein [Terriglobia bacterium]